MDDTAAGDDFAESDEPLADRLKHQRESTVGDYLALCRFPAVFTALADPLMGIAVATVIVPTTRPLSYLIAFAGGAFYLFGMVDNAIVDLDEDRENEPGRPLPSGRVSLLGAKAFRFLLLATGIGITFLVDASVPKSGIHWTVAGILVSVLAYNRFKNLHERSSLQRVPLIGLVGPLLMGLCRFLNVLLGINAAGYGGLKHGFKGTLADPMTVAIALGIYVFALTRFAQQEARLKQATLTDVRINLLLAVAFLAGILNAAGWMHAASLPTPRVVVASVVLLVIWLGIVIWKAGPAVRDPQPSTIGPAVGLMVLAIIPIDATIAYGATGSLGFAFGILSLLIPALVLRRIKIT